MLSKFWHWHISKDIHLFKCLDVHFIDVLTEVKDCHMVCVALDPSIFVLRLSISIAIVSTLTSLPGNPGVCKVDIQFSWPV